jgi:hypothetical protein
MDLSRDALPVHGLRRGQPRQPLPSPRPPHLLLGELSFEIAVPASEGLALWETLMDLGREWASRLTAPRPSTCSVPRRATS